MAKLDLTYCRKCGRTHKPGPCPPASPEVKPPEKKSAPVAPRQPSVPGRPTAEDLSDAEALAKRVRELEAKLAAVTGPKKDRRTYNREWMRAYRARKKAERAKE